MRITIVGGGALGHACAGFLSSQENVCINVYTGHPEQWSKEIIIVDLEGKCITGKLGKISRNLADVAVCQDLILLCLPGFLIENTLRKLKPLIGSAIVGSVVSSTGFFFYAHSILGDDAKLFGFQRVPFIARVSEYGKSANILGYKSSLSMAVENIEDKELFKETIEHLFKIPVFLLSSFYEAAFSNSNPILHTGRLFSIFQGREKYVFDHNVFFYREWNDEASQMIIEMDKEFFKLLDSLKVRTEAIPTLLDYYESFDAHSLTKKISSIPAFQSILTPMVRCGIGWVVDVQNRYFTEDFPYGLRWIFEMAKQNNICVPVIDKVYSWGVNLLNSKEIQK